MKICKIKCSNQWLKSINGYDFELVDNKKEASTFIFEPEISSKELLNELFSKLKSNVSKGLEIININY